MFSLKGSSVLKVSAGLAGFQLLPARCSTRLDARSCGQRNGAVIRAVRLGLDTGAPYTLEGKAVNSYCMRPPRVCALCQIAQGDSDETTLVCGAGAGGRGYRVRIVCLFPAIPGAKHEYY